MTSDATKEGEPVKRWTLHAHRRPSNHVDDGWDVFGPRPRTAWTVDNSLKGENVEVMPVADHEQAVADLREEIALVSEQRDMIDAAGEAALLAARQVDEAAVERAARAWWSRIGGGIGGGSWSSQPMDTKARYREMARAALLAALNAPKPCPESEVERMSETHERARVIARAILNEDMSLRARANEGENVRAPTIGEMANRLVDAVFDANDSKQVS